MGQKKGYSKYWDRKRVILNTGTEKSVSLNPGTEKELI
jgi:hypothetical protein